MFSRFQGSPPPTSNISHNITPQELMNHEQRFSLLHLKQLHQQLVNNRIITPDNEDLVVEILYTIAEMVVYGDNKSELLFDYFCEKNMLSLFLDIMWSRNNNNNDDNNMSSITKCPSKVHIQILQTLSILINSVKNDTSLYYLLSNNYINEIIIFPHIFDDDESLRDQFVSFMKSLSIRLNTQTVQFFFVEETGAFPLFSRAVDILRYNEPMVRIACQTTVLNVLQVSDTRSRAYVLQNDLLNKFLSEVIFILTNYYQSITKISNEYYAITKDDNETNSIANSLAISRLENSLDDISAALEDWLYFLQDLLGLKIKKLRDATIQAILAKFIYPILLQPVNSLKSYACNSDNPIFSIRKNADSVDDDTQEVITDSNTIHDDILNEPFNNLAALSDVDTTDFGGLSHRVAILDANIPAPERSTSLVIDRDAVKEANGIHRKSSSLSNSRDVSTSLSSSSAIKQELSSSIGNDDQPDMILSEKEASIRMAVSLFYLSQMVCIIVDPFFVRGINIALLHPLNVKIRDKLLSELSSISPHMSSLTSNDLNMTRVLFQSLITYGDRLSLLSSLLFFNLQAITSKILSSESLTTISSNNSISTEMFTVISLIQSDSLLLWNKNQCLQNHSIIELLDDTPRSPTSIPNSYSSSPIKSSFESSYLTSMSLTTEEKVTSQEIVSYDTISSYSNIADNRYSNSARSMLSSSLNDLKSRCHLSISEFLDIDNIFMTYDTIDNETMKSSGSVNEDSVHHNPYVMSIKSFVDLGLSYKSSNIINDSFLDSLYCLLYAGLDKCPLVSLQVAVYSIYYEALRLQSVISSYDILDSNLSRSTDFSSNNQITLPYDIWVLQDILTVQDLQNIIHYMLSKAMFSGSLVASALSLRLSGPLKDLIIDITLEELNRQNGCSISSYQTKISQLSLLLLPTTKLSLDKLGCDHTIPTNQIDALRREIQIFILIRSLYIQLKRMVTSPKDTFSIDDIAGRVLDDSLWSIFTLKTVIPNEIVVGRPFRMKGKKYLDICDRSDLHDQLNGPQTPESTTSSFLSSLTFGYFGSATSTGTTTSTASNTKRPVTANSPVTSSHGSNIGQNTLSPAAVTALTNAFITISPSSDIPLPSTHALHTDHLTTKTKRNTSYGELLFVQDRSYIIIVKPDASNVRSTSADKQKDAAVDADDKSTLRFTVKAWEGDLSYPNMEAIGSDILSSIQSDSLSYQNRRSTYTTPHYSIPTLLHPKKPTKLYQFSIGFESVQACALAAEHVESRRQSLRDDKMRYLKKALDSWTMSDAPSSATRESGDSSKSISQ